MSTPLIIPSGRMLKDASWPWDTEQEKPMQTAAGRRKSSMPESVTGEYSKLVDKSASHDDMLTRGSDKSFGPEPHSWTDAELRQPPKYRVKLWDEV